MNTHSFPRLRLSSITVTVLSKFELLTTLVNWSQSPVFRSVFYANAHTANVAARNPELTDLWSTADLVFCDGNGVRVASLFHGLRAPERLTVMDWIDELLAGLSRKNVPIFLLGEPPTVAHEAARQMRLRHPGLEIAGCHHGFLKTSEDIQNSINEVRESGASVILIGMGSPLQERWIHDFGPICGVSEAIAVGGALRSYAGLSTRAPAWLRKLGLEWMWRLMDDPRRLFGRYAFGIPRFVTREFLHAVGYR